MIRLRYPFENFLPPLRITVVLGMWFLSLGSAFSETEVDIRGLESIDESRLLRVIGKRLVYVREKPANRWRANDAAFLVQEVLRKEGFPDVEVSAEIKAKNKIALNVKEGQRLFVGRVEIDGEDSSDSLAELFIVPFEKHSLLQAVSTPYRESNIEEGLDFVLNKLKSNGYWRAEVSLKEKEIDAEAGQVNLVLSVDKGPRFKIGTPTVDSPDGRGVKRAATTWAPYIGMWATTKNINSLRTDMVEAFIGRGYPNATIFMDRRLGNETYFPKFRIELGTRVKLLDIDFEGLDHTRLERLEQIMEPLKGEWYDEATLNKRVRKLLNTGAFNSVQVETHEVATKRIDATLHLVEAKAKEISFSAGASSFKGPLLRTKYIDRNFHGTLRAFSAGLEFNTLGVLGELKLADPWWLGTDIVNEYRWYSLIEEYDGYTIFESGLENRLKWEVTDHYAMNFLLGYSFAKVNDEGLPPALLGDSLYNHLKVGVTPSWDYRDNAVLPKSGWHLNLPIQVGAVVGDEMNNYLKLGLNGGWYYPINEEYQLGIGGFAEWLVPSGDSLDLPVALRVFNGGPGSVRSFPERQLGPSSGGDAYGGDFSWAIQNELSREITGPLRALAFIDAGGVSGNYIAPVSGGVELAAGLGLRLDLPIGALRLEYGHNLTRDFGEPSGTWHFAIGTTF